MQRKSGSGRARSVLPGPSARTKLVRVYQILVRVPNFGTHTNLWYARTKIRYAYQILVRVPVWYVRKVRVVGMMALLRASGTSIS